MHKKPLIINSKIAYKGYFNVKVNELKKEDGQTGTTTILEPGYDAVVILAKDEKGLYLINEEYRPGIDKYVLCAPGGKIEKGEDPIVAAKREFLEETGFSSENFYPMGFHYPMPSILNQTLHFFFADNIKKIKEQALDSFEFINIKFFSEKELKELIIQKKPIDAILLSSLYLILSLKL